MACKLEVMSYWQEDASRKVVGSYPGASKDFFLTKYLLKRASCRICILWKCVKY